MNPYTYRKATSLADAVSARGQSDTFLLAGGTDLIAQMKSGHRIPAAIVDVKQIPELITVAVSTGGDLEIGAAVTATTLAGNAHLRQHHAALHDAVQLIGSLQVQNRATVGGNICNAAPSADAVPALIADAAMANIAGPGGVRTILLEELFTGPGRTALGAGELLVSVTLPKRAARSASVYLRFTPRREMDIAIAGAAARIDVDDSGAITAAWISLASVAPTPIRAPNAEAHLQGNTVSAKAFAEAAIAAQSDATPISDTRASADYRRDLIAVLVRRALEGCAKRLNLEVLA
jgi:CO/xanthine dehydrogenase FAD-binding subunit